jgi:hypothetical protein
VKLKRLTTFPFLLRITKSTGCFTDTIHGESGLVTCSSKEAPAKVPTYHNASAHAKIHLAPMQLKKSHVNWTTEEDMMLLQMRNNGCFWEDISAAHPGALFDEVQKVILWTEPNKLPPTGGHASSVCLLAP